MFKSCVKRVSGNGAVSGALKYDLEDPVMLKCDSVHVSPRNEALNFETTGSTL